MHVFPLTFIDAICVFIGLLLYPFDAHNTVAFPLSTILWHSQQWFCLIWYSFNFRWFGSPLKYSFHKFSTFTFADGAQRNEKLYVFSRFIYLNLALHVSQLFQCFSVLNTDYCSFSGWNILLVVDSKSRVDSELIRVVSVVSNFLKPKP